MPRIVDGAILDVAKVYLKFAPTPPPYLHDIFQAYLPLAADCYKRAAYWHGTGRFHYTITGKTKYEGIDFSMTEDILQSIIDSNGLLPQYDPIIEISGVFKDTVSLSKYRMYARAYAGFNQYEHIPLSYTYGVVKFWFYLGFTLQMLHGNLLKNVIRLLQVLYDEEIINKSQPWMHTFKSPTDSFQWTPLNFYTIKSDIPHNYALLFAISHEGVHPIKFDPLLERFETRTDRPVTLNHIVHIEVPLANVEETEALLHHNNVRIPVIPLEVGELYCRRYSLTHLTGTNFQKSLPS